MRFRVISHIMIFFALLKIFILNSSMSSSFSYLKASKLFNTRAILSIYTLIIMSSSSHLMMRMYVSALIRVKPIF